MVTPDMQRWGQKVKDLWTGSGPIINWNRFSCICLFGGLKWLWHTTYDITKQDSLNTKAAFGYGSKKGTQKTLLVKGKIDQNLWSPLGFSFWPIAICCHTWQSILSHLGCFKAPSQDWFTSGAQPPFGPVDYSRRFKHEATPDFLLYHRDVTQPLPGREALSFYCWGFKRDHYKSRLWR